MNQTTLPFGSPAQHAIDAVADKADRINSGWTDRAFAALQSWARGRTAPFLIEDARHDIESQIGFPHDGRAWGAVTQRAIRSGAIVATGGYRAAESSNASPKRLYVGEP